VLIVFGEQEQVVGKKSQECRVYCISAGDICSTGPICIDCWEMQKYETVLSYTL